MKYTENMESRLFDICDEEDFDREEQILDFLQSPDSFRDFGESLTNFIGEIKPESVGKERECLVESAKIQGITFNRNTINNWFSGTRPKKGEQSREHMYLICFALQLSLDKTKDFFKRVYFDRPFNLRDKKEFVYYCCIKDSKSYTEARHIIEKLSDTQCVAEIEDRTIYTSLIENEARSIDTEEEIVNYINTHPHNFEISSITAKALLQEIIEQVKASKEDKEKYRKNTVDSGCSYTVRECSLYKEQKENQLLEEFKDICSISSMLDIILGINVVKSQKNTSIFKNDVLPHEIMTRFPTKQSFSAKNPSFEELRKEIILLKSYAFWFEKQYGAENTKAQEEKKDEWDLDTYIDEMDALLTDANFTPLYLGNPFDWLFMYCSTAREPLELFRGIMLEVLQPEA